MKKDKTLTKLRWAKVKELYQLAKPEGNLTQSGKSKIINMYIFSLLIRKINKSNYWHLIEGKGAFSLISNLGIQYGTTRDLDLNWFEKIDNTSLKNAFLEIFKQHIPEDKYIIFEDVEVITTDENEIDERVKFKIKLKVKFYDIWLDLLTIDLMSIKNNSKIPSLKLKTIFNEETNLLSCPTEVTIAEKTFAMFNNPDNPYSFNPRRVKDFYAIHRIFNNFDSGLNLNMLLLAMKETAFKFHLKIDFKRWKYIIDNLNQEEFLQSAITYYNKSNPEFLIDIEILQDFLHNYILYFKNNKEFLKDIIDEPDTPTPKKQNAFNR